MTEIPPPFDTLWFKIVIGLIVGLVLGSFITMLSYRAPRRLSIIHPNSHCPKCHAALEPRDLIPVLSWVIEQGKCRHCGAAISIRYLLIECATACASALAFALLGFQPAVIVALLGVVAFVTLATINLERH